LAIVIIEHRVPLMMSLCDRIMALDFGRVIALGTAPEVAKNEAVIEAYLGSDTEATSLAR
jgi:branched-chain amino acid transport system ATP-binding protein